MYPCYVSLTRTCITNQLFVYIVHIVCSSIPCFWCILEYDCLHGRIQRFHLCKYTNNSETPMLRSEHKHIDEDKHIHALLRTKAQSKYYLFFKFSFMYRKTACLVKVCSDQQSVQA